MDPLPCQARGFGQSRGGGYTPPREPPCRSGARADIALSWCAHGINPASTGAQPWRNHGPERTAATNSRNERVRCPQALRCNDRGDHVVVPTVRRADATARPAVSAWARGWEVCRLPPSIQPSSRPWARTSGPLVPPCSPARSEHGPDRGASTPWSWRRAQITCTMPVFVSTGGCPLSSAPAWTTRGGYLRAGEHMADPVIADDGPGQGADALWDDIASELYVGGREACAGTTALGPNGDPGAPMVSRRGGEPPAR